jgi:hypothetical protein
MPAPQSSAMKQLARLKFMSFSLKVPSDWKEPSGDPAAAHYGRAFKPEEKVTSPGMPPLFQPASLNKYHTDAQKMHNDKIGSFIDKTCDAICSAWSTWQSAATMAGILVNGPVAAGGALVGPPITPLILAQGAKDGPMAMKYTNVIASVIGTAWQTFTTTVKVAGLTWYPLLAACPAPTAPPTPNIPMPFAALVQVPVSISASVMKMQMVGQLGDPSAPFHKELFESICDAFEKSYNIWKVSTMVTNVLAVGGAVPTMTTPVPVPGPVIAAVATMTPGGLV